MANSQVSAGRPIRTRKNSVEAELDAMDEEINLVDDVESFLTSLQVCSLYLHSGLWLQG